MCVGVCVCVCVWGWVVGRGRRGANMDVCVWGLGGDEHMDVCVCAPACVCVRGGGQEG